MELLSKEYLKFIHESNLKGWNEFLKKKTNVKLIENEKFKGLNLSGFNFSGLFGYFGLMVPPFSVQMMPLLKTLQLLDE